MQNSFYTKSICHFCQPLLKVALGCALLLSAGQVLAQNEPWNVYTGDVMPNESTPAFVLSSVNPAASAELPAIVPAEQSIIENPDMPGNKVLSFKIMGAPNHVQFLWRRNFPDPPAAPTAATVVVKAKGLPGVDRVFEMDLDFAGTRGGFIIYSNGTYTIRGNSESFSLGAGFDPMQWHTYRFTKTASNASFYLDENPTPIATATIAADTRTNNYFRFGDGNSDPTTGALFDWVIWDNTGAYSPAQKALPSATVLAVTPDAVTPASTSIYPNPLNGSRQALVRFSLPTASDVNIQIFDITGKKVGQPHAFRNLKPDDHELAIPVADLTGGIYFFQISTSKYTATQKLIVR
ncbi:T9SS type A sorting domain-containing protein [Botryobacter ruber]|uniref:T9SS type A sorting domain-containing protein n=1 Tax=Botryobacter ruber TaxID=2171629 RepID=UPI000E0A43D3|nr:T9SS type A sorting domain-containing protein [Botryobacter ruber]